MLPSGDPAMPACGWRKSSYSGDDGDCVEVRNSARVVAVRDTADRHGPVITLTTGAWRAFTGALKA